MLVKNACEDCHLENSEVVIPTTDKCLSCHGSYLEIAKKTEKMEDIKRGISNPHKSHIGEVRCTLCHKIHSSSVLYCNTCHSPHFSFQVP
jgi:fumarate reductase flavoprotein subunit